MNASETRSSASAVTGQLARQAPSGVDVAREELAVGVDVTAADGRDQLRITGAVDRQRDAHNYSNGGNRDL